MINTPLAERMRPKILEDYIGQEHLVGKDGVLKKSVDSGRMPSLILWGPPGTGKTTLAQIIATSLKRPFHILSAINSGVKDIRETIDKARKQNFFGSPNPILFIDEIHRFSKSQQDSLLNAVEKGIVTLIGATTENPSFEVIPALLSRGQVYISAFIKSIRGSDPNATTYYLARMIEGGEDIKFICRRMMIAASEDIGLANPNALLLATSCFQAVQAIGLPEARILLSQTAVYLAISPKSNSTYEAIAKAQAEVRLSGDLPVPIDLRNAPTKLMKSIGYGAEYKYAHAYENNFTNMEFLPEGLSNVNFYTPGNNAQENKIAERLKSMWKDKYDF
ncbi:UNVERIFIED_CONTAM: hypothetical protein GTU68_028619 [Idotea baltica]|nr:hypothetical protein [Idotea baltica]